MGERRKTSFPSIKRFCEVYVEVSIIQGALAGGWFGLVFNMIVILGDWIASPHQEHLPTNTMNCTDYGINPDDIQDPPEDP